MIGARPTTRQQYFFGLTLQEIAVSIALSMLVGTGIFFFVSQTTGWAVFGLTFTAFVIFQIFFSSARVIVLPEFITAISCLNWVVMPWLSYLYPPSFRQFEMYIPMNDYMSYAVPCAVSLWFGLHITLRHSGERSIFETRVLSVHDVRAVDLMILFSTLIFYFQRYLPHGIDFFYYILANFRYVGVFMLMLSGVRGWWWRAAVVYVATLSASAAGGVFYEFLMWFGYLVICWSFLKRWRAKLLILLILAFLGTTELNTVKMEYRKVIATRTLTAVERLQVLGEMFYSHLTGSEEGRIRMERGDQIVRWNQGWIISRVLDYVPRNEPHAQGSTIVQATLSSLLPRAFFPTKIGAVSREFFEQYTGLHLSYTTSMGLGVAAECYVNFGRWYGIFAVFLYGIFISRAFSIFSKRARTNILWWAWLPFVMLSSLVAEWNLSDILNNIVKSYIVMLLLLHSVPVLKKHFKR